MIAVMTDVIADQFHPREVRFRLRGRILPVLDSRKAADGRRMLRAGCLRGGGSWIPDTFHRVSEVPQCPWPYPMQMVRSHRTGRGGARGQHHSSAPRDLASYEVPPAGPVQITRLDGSVEEQFAQPVERTSSRRRRARTQSADPVPIDHIRGDGSFVPANLRNVEPDEQGRPRTAGWTRNNRDALPPGHRG